MTQTGREVLDIDCDYTVARTTRPAQSILLLSIVNGPAGTSALFHYNVTRISAAAVVAQLIFVSFADMYFLSECLCVKKWTRNLRIWK